MEESKGPEGWEAEDFERDKIRELREEGMDPGSAQEKLKALGHPSARSMGGHPTEGDAEAPEDGSKAPGSD